MTMVVLDELIAAAPMIIAPGLTVVTAGTARLDTFAEELAVVAGASNGLALSTPE
jgi:hypothetical protein